MAQYLYLNPVNGEVKEVTQKMSEPHVYSENGIEWKRVYTLPQMGISTRVDAFSEKQFLDKTKNVKTFGEAFQISQEMSEQRASKLGSDPTKEKYFKEYSANRKGRKHLEQIKQESGTL
jgi:hypothetical protein